MKPLFSNEARPVSRPARAGLFAFSRSLLVFLCFFAAAPIAAQLDAVVATVDRTLITRQDLRFHVLELRLYEPEMWSVPDEVLERKALTDAIHEHLLYRELWRDGRDPGEAEAKKAADAAWGRLEHLAGSPQQLEIVLRRSGLKAADVRRWLQDRAKRLWVIEGELANRLDPSYFNQPEPTPDEAAELQLAQIFVKSIDRTSEEQWTLARQRLLRMKGDLDRGVLTFEQAAAVFSDDGLTAKSGGEIGWVSPGQLDPEVLSALRPLKVGGVSDPVRGKEGWYLFRLLDMDTPRRRDLRRETQRMKRELLVRLRAEKDILLADGYELEGMEADAAPAASEESHE